MTPRRQLALTLLGLLLASPAWAVGPVVGPGCTTSWDPVINFTDLTPIAPLIPTYDLYVVSGVQVAPAVPPFQTGITTTSAAACVGRAAGQYTAFVSAVVGGTEGAVGNAAPFVLSLKVPSAPTNTNVKP